jgi:hypothetical protein
LLHPLDEGRFRDRLPAGAGPIGDRLVELACLGEVASENLGPSLDEIIEVLLHHRCSRVQFLPSGSQ